MSIEPLPESRDALIRSLGETGLASDVVSHLVSQARPAVLLLTSAAEEDEIPLGASKIGGRPDLPKGAGWPTRPPYPDAMRRVERHQKRADRLLADSRKAGSWMSPEQGERFSRHLRRGQTLSKYNFHWPSSDNSIFRYSRGMKALIQPCRPRGAFCCSTISGSSRRNSFPRLPSAGK
jgi:hypothetical protein